MSNRFLAYLQREHERLDQALAAACAAPSPDWFEVARLKKLKLATKDQIAAWCAETDTPVAA